MQDNRITECQSLLNEIWEEKQVLINFNADGKRDEHEKVKEAIRVVTQELNNR